MSDTETAGPEASQGGEGELPRNDLGELIIGEDITVVGLDFEAGNTVREIRQEIDELLIEYGKDIDLARDRIGLIIEAQNLYFDGRVSKGLDDATAREASSLIAALRQPKGLLVKQVDLEIGIMESLKDSFLDAIERMTKIATMTAEAKSEISQNDMLKDLLDQQELEDGFEPDIESPLSWSQENWQQVASMTPKEQEYFAGIKKRSNASKRVWARRANEMLDDEIPDYTYKEWKAMEVLAAQAEQANAMLKEQARQEAISKGLDPDTVTIGNYNYTEWKAMEVLAAQAEQANAMLKEQARQEAISKGLDPDTITIGNYNYPEWVAMKALLSAEAREANEMLYQSMIEEARQKEADLGYKPNTLLVKKPNYTYEEWIAMKALAAQAELANTMLHASELAKAQEKAGAQGKNTKNVRVEKPNYTYEEWKAMEALHKAIKERQSDAAKRGWATRMNAKLPSGEEYTYQQWQDINALVQAANDVDEVDQSLDVSAD